MAKAEKTEEQSTSVAVQSKAGLPAGLDMSVFANDSGAGSQNVTSSDMQTPIISVLQANSPQCKKSDGKYIKGAEEGMFFNNVTNEVYSGEDGIRVVPCFFEKVYIEWKPNRGGFVEAHPASTPLKDQIKMIPSSENPDKLIPVLPNGNLLIETNQHYVLRLKDDGGFEPAVLAMSSSALKTSRQWNYLVKSVTEKGPSGPFNPASYFCQYKLSTVARQNGDYSWAGMKVENLGYVPGLTEGNYDIYNAGKALEKAVNAGTVRVKQEPTDHAAGPSAPVEEEIPFD